MEVFRTRETTEPTEPTEERIIEPTETTGIVEDKEDISIKTEPVKHDQLTDWETKNGKYGLEIFNIKEIANEFPLKVNFSIIDKYIKSEIETRNYENNTENYQKILEEIESEIDTSRLESFSRLKRIAEYIKVLNKLYEAKKLKEKYLISDTTE